MRIALISRSWPSYERSGVSLAAALHSKMLVELGHYVAIVGSDVGVLKVDAPCHERHFIAAKGSGALYSPVQINVEEILLFLANFRPDVVVVEAWQTALTDTFVEAASQTNIPVLMISHGVSVAPFSVHWKDWIRAMAWQYYRWVKLTKLIRNLSAITTLDPSSRSSRFIDRDIALRYRKPVLVLGNPPINWNDSPLPRQARKDEILVVGYYSRVKNQLAALELALALRDTSIRFKFVGPRNGVYLESCVRFVQKHGLQKTVTFLTDNECNLAEAIGTCLAVLSTSITEALPITLIESMASGTPFIATDVGAVSSLRGGVIANSTKERKRLLLTLRDDQLMWNDLSTEGRSHFIKSFTYQNIRDSLRDVIYAVSSQSSHHCQQ